MPTLLNFSPAHFTILATSGGWLSLFVGFYAAGLALAFTPCCLPLLPIVIGLIARQTPKPSTGKALLLSTAYVFGAALSYAAGGALFSAAGAELQMRFQAPWVVLAFACFFILLALSMLGAFTLQMPSSLQSKLAALSARQNAASLAGMTAIGALSALIVTACVAPALVGALAVISRTGDVLRGTAALFVLGIGMGTPLIVIGASAGRLIPQSGPWMLTVKRLFSAVLMAVAVGLLGKIVPERTERILWTVPFFMAAFILLKDAPRRSARGWLQLAASGACTLAVAYLLLWPSIHRKLSTLEGHPSAASVPAVHFMPLTSLSGLTTALKDASRNNKPLLVDFSAQWCASCKEMDETTFASRKVRKQLQHFILYRIDLTADTRADRAILSRFKVYGPPTVLLFGPLGLESHNERVVGYMPPNPFSSRLNAVLAEMR